MAIFARPHDGPNLFSLPPGRPFFDDVARALLSDFEVKPEGLADVRIYLPSRRSVRALKESFAKLTEGRPLLLPRMTAIADISEDDVISASIERQAPPLPQAPNPITKRLVLARIYREAREQAGLPIPDWPTALRAAGELARTSDLLTEYGITAQDLETLGEQPAMVEGAEHWRTLTRVLALVTEAWPRWLEEHGQIDVRTRRNALLQALAESQPSAPDAPLVLAAGFLGTSPSSQVFLKHIAGLPSGAVILPALDPHLSDEAWELIEEPHPQSSYKHLFQNVFPGISRRDVQMLPYTEEPAARARRELLSIALMPAEATDAWTELFGNFRARPEASTALDGLSIAVAPTSEDEADWIALALRETLTQEGKTAALVTADRILARRVAAKLSGWGINIDDSGGRPLHASYRATFLRAIARLMDEPSDAVAMATMIHHQLFALGMSSKDRRPLVRTFDQFLRGVRPRPGWSGLLESLGDSWRPFRADEESSARVASLTGKLKNLFTEHDPGPGASLAQRLRGHLRLAAELARTPADDGQERLYRFEDGEVLQAHFDAFLDRDVESQAIAAEDYATTFDALLAMAPAVRPPGGQHPRVSVYGVLEARLQTADLLVVGGLQEGVWPGDEVIDPFLSRGMRHHLGIPSPEADIGRVAHDFMDFAAAPKVLLTRAERRGPTVARPSRFMIRLESFVDALSQERSVWDRSSQLSAWQLQRHGNEDVPKPAPRPAPKPPLSVRPRRLSVSGISRWLRDPYAVYASSILKLRNFSPYDAVYGPAEKGMLLHAWAEETIVRSPEDIDEIAAVMDECLPEILHSFAFPEAQHMLGSAFLTAMRESFPAFQAQAQAHGKTLGTEIDGELVLKVAGDDFVITGRADRIDRMESGAHIVDYKSSATPTLDEAKAFAPQLFLMAQMMAAGGFKSLPKLAPEQVSFVNLKGAADVFGAGKDKGKTYARKAALDELLSEFSVNFAAWLDTQFRPSTPFPSQLAPHSVNDVGDYDDLARRLEWARGGDDE
ncbi:MAG: double-strand break repair protein AddB [Pseudomonadota bacterium]